jgi:ankyrin repeat protein
MTRATWDELAIEAAAHMGLAPMAHFLADLGAPVSTCTATLLGAKDLVKRLVGEDRACLRERGAHDLPLLAYTAFAEQQVDVAEFLLAAGADVHIRAFGQTTLLDKGADINALASSQGVAKTPLAVAVERKQTKMVEFLSGRGGRS